MLKPHLNFLKLTPVPRTTSECLKPQELVANAINQHRPFANFDHIDDILEDINASHSHLKFKPKFIVVLGIGGSSLGAKVLTEALGHRHLLHKNIFFVDSVDPDSIALVDQSIIYDQTLFFVVSNSGNTIETLSQAYFFLDRSESASIDISRHFQFILGNKESELFKLAIKYSSKIFNWPPNLCGRFSVFSLAALMPASYMGVDVKSVLQHASKLNLKYTIDNEKINSALQTAIDYSDFLNAGFKNLVLFNYSDKLKSFGDWACQLISESLGKSDMVPTPILARGVTDQHSSLQLFKMGPNDKFYIFIYPHQFENNNLQIAPLFQRPVDYLRSETFARLHTFEMQGTIQSLVESQRPVVTLSIEEFDEWQVTSLLLFFMYFTFFLSEIIGCNCFDQPGVEKSKVITKQLLVNNKIYNA